MPEWKTYRFGDVTTNFDARRVPLRAPDRTKGPYPYYGASGIIDYVEGYLFDGEFLLVAEDGENLRTRKTPIAFLADGQFWVNNHAHIVKANHLANIRYLSYLISEVDVSGYLSGSTQPKLTQAAMNLMRIRLPPKEYQDGVAEVLRALDDKIAVNERASATALALAEAIYLRGERSREWKDVALADAATWYSGGTPRTSNATYWGGDLPWISALSLKSPWITESDRNLTPLGATSGTRMVPRGTIVFVVRGSSLKNEFRIGITQREVAFGQDCKALVPKGGIDSDLLFHAIRARTPDVLDLVDETGIGAGRLNTDLIGRLTVRVPDAERDPTVVALRHLNRLAAAREQENRKLAELRDQLLPRLMSGEIRVREAEAVVSEAVVSEAT